MSERCEVCGPNKQEAPTMVCAPCALSSDPDIQAGSLGMSIVEVAGRYLNENAARVYLSKRSK